MSAILHLVADDWVSGQALASRVGSYSAAAIATGSVDAPFALAPPPATALRKATKLGPDLVPTITGLKVLNKIASPVWPANGKARTFELIARAVGTAPPNALQLAIVNASGTLGLILGINATNLYSADLAIEVFDSGIAAEDNIDAVTYAPSLDGLYHYWTFVIDFTGAPIYTLYDGATVVRTAAWPFGLTNYDALASDATAFLGIQMEQPFGSSDYGAFVEMMVHDTALSASRIKQRTLHFRSFG